ncbi:hypothetical protein KAT92_06120 [Candidatus Babeliales bacterium]|nr:hypothetical protein [Candidatus Babeliales bacterium]
MIISFELFNDKTAASLGELSDITGSRPSDLFNWTDVDEWYERLMFDLFIVGKMSEKREEDMPKR